MSRVACSSEVCDAEDCLLQTSTLVGPDSGTVLEVTFVVNVGEGGIPVSQKVVEWMAQDGKSPLDSKFDPDYVPPSAKR
ncbi:MAG: hypothetical protein U0996_26030 [Planctomycetaceae bacterium]